MHRLLESIAVLILSILVIGPHFIMLGNFQHRFKYKENMFNMAYKQLLEDLADKFGSYGTILQLVSEAGTTYWSEFNIINLNSIQQSFSLKINETLNSNNLSYLFNFYEKYAVRFLIFPSPKNWYYGIYLERFINQSSFTRQHFPNIQLILASLEQNEVIPIYVKSCNFTFNLNPYDYYDVYIISSESFMEETNLQVIADDNQSNFWAPVEWGTGSIGRPLISDCTEKKKDGLNSLRIEVSIGMSLRWGIRHDYDSPQDWSDKDFVYLDWYGINSKKDLKIAFISSLPWKDYFEVTITENWIGWKRIVIPLKAFYSVGSPTWNSITRVVIWMADDASGIWYLDQLALGFSN